MQNDSIVYRQWSQEGNPMLMPHTNHFYFEIMLPKKIQALMHVIEYDASFASTRTLCL